LDSNLDRHSFAHPDTDWDPDHDSHFFLYDDLDGIGNPDVHRDFVFDRYGDSNGESDGIPTAYPNCHYHRYSHLVVDGDPDVFWHADPGGYSDSFLDFQLHPDGLYDLDHD